MIDKKEVLYVAHLARLDFSDEEAEKFASQLNDILLHMDRLNKVETSGVAPVSHAIALTDAFREDLIADSLGSDLATANAPEAGEGFFVVPRVVE